jgi:hypothetical protein
VRQVIRAVDDVSAATCASAMASGSSGGAGVTAGVRESSGIRIVSALGSGCSGTSLSAGRTSTSVRGAAGAGLVAGRRGEAWTIGVELAGRLSPATFTSFTAGKSGGCGPAANERTGTSWLRWIRTPTQTPVSAISARMICRSRISPLMGITRLVSAWEAHVFN